MNKEFSNKRGFLKDKSVEIAVGLVLTLISVFIINRIDKIDNRLRTVEMDISSIKTTIETVSENQGTLLGNDGDNRTELKLIELRLKTAEKDIKELNNTLP